MTQAEVRKMFIRAYPGVRRIGRKGYWYRCAHCGKWCGRSGGDNIRLNSSELMEVDHIIPWSKGGSDSLYNLQPLCRPCNRSKSADPTFIDGMKGIKNTVMHPVDSLVAAPLRKAARQNKILKRLGITSRK